MLLTCVKVNLLNILDFSINPNPYESILMKSLKNVLILACFTLYNRCKDVYPLTTILVKQEPCCRLCC